MDNDPYALDLCGEKSFRFVGDRLRGTRAKYRNLYETGSKRSNGATYTNESNRCGSKIDEYVCEILCNIDMFGVRANHFGLVLSSSLSGAASLPLLPFSLGLTRPCCPAPPACVSCSFCSCHFFLTIPFSHTKTRGKLRRLGMESHGCGRMERKHSD